VSTGIDQRFPEAQLLTRITNAEKVLDFLPGGHWEEADSEFPGVLSRAKTLLELAGVIVGAVDADLVTEEMVDQVGENVDQILGQLTAFRDDGDLVNVEALQRQEDELAEALTRWPYAGGVPLEDVREAASRFRRSAGQQLSALESELRRLAEEVEHSNRLAPEITSSLSAAEAAFRERLEELQRTVEQQQTRLDQIISEQQSQFSDAQERRLEAFNEQSRNLDAQISRLGEDLREQAEESARAAETSATELVEKIQAQLTKAQDVVGAIATTGIVGGYKQEADRQAKTANNLRRGAIAALLAAALLAVWAVIHAQANDASIEEVVSKALASVVFGVLAGYLASQSGRHREREAAARKREIDLAAFGPFIQDLPAEQREKAIAELAARLFGQDDAVAPSEILLTTERVGLIGQLSAILRGDNSA
jgi:DNA repair exonuclease SbcCD ATPase subunit